MKLNLSFDIAIIISIVAVFLFANGQAYLGSYLNIFGIDITILNFSVQDKIYYGYLKGFDYLLNSIYVFIGYIILIFGIRYTNCLTKLNNYIDKKINKNNKKLLSIHNSNFYDDLEKSYKNHSTLAVFILIFLIATLLLLVNSEKKAKDIAYEDIKTFNFKQVQLKDKSNKSDVFLIKCGTTLCALIDRNKNVTLEDPKNIIFFVQPEKK